MKTKLLTICLLLVTSQVFALEECKGVYSLKWNNCTGTKFSFDDGRIYFVSKRDSSWQVNKATKEYDGEFKDGLYDGYGTLTYLEYGLKVGEFSGEFRNNKRYKGTHTYFDNGLYVGKFTGEFRNNKRYKGIMINPLGNEKKFDLKTSKNNREIIGMWHLIEDIGGLRRFEWGYFRKIITIIEEDLYKAYVISYRWRLHDGCKDIYFYHDGTECFRNEDPDECGGADETRTEMVCSDYSVFEFIPTKYFENKISDFESEKHFVSNIVRTSFKSRYKVALTEDRYLNKLLWSQEKTLGCMQKNMNEVFYEDQIFQRRDNLDISKTPKIWGCIYNEPAEVFLYDDKW